MTEEGRARPSWQGGSPAPPACPRLPVRPCEARRSRKRVATGWAAGARPRCSSRHADPGPTAAETPALTPARPGAKDLAPCLVSARPRPRGPGSLWGWSTAPPVAAPCQTPTHLEAAIHRI